VIRYALLGFATGGRTFAGPTAVAWTSGNQLAQRLTAVAALGEVVVDKLPQTPSRLEPGALVARAATSAVAAMVLARRRGDDQRLAAWVAMLAAGAGVTAGSRWRRLTATPNAVAGAAEDVVVAAVAWAAVR
jgi:uncharacterized membrane protein